MIYLWLNIKNYINNRKRSCSRGGLIQDIKVQIVQLVVAVAVGEESSELRAAHSARSLSHVKAKTEVARYQIYFTLAGLRQC